MYPLFASIFAPHLGQVITIFPFPTGTLQMAPHLQVKYLCSLSARRALAPAALFRAFQIQPINFWFSARRLVRFLENIRNRINTISTQRRDSQIRAGIHSRRRLKINWATRITR